MPKTAPFDQYADQYDKWFENNQAIFQTELEAIRQLIPSNNLEGIEVGVGSGKFAAPLGIKVGIEPSMEMAVKAEKLGIEVWKSVAEKLPFTDARFDFVLMVTVLCFVDDMTKSERPVYFIRRLLFGLQKKFRSSFLKQDL
jgi:SAM-dependent methyltransferase